MGILQEYRFYLIIAVIALAGLIILFFVTQNKSEYVRYGTDFTSSYAKIKSIAGAEKSLADVVSVDGITLVGTKGNSLFGKTLEGEPGDILLVDEDGIGTIPNPTTVGNYTITYVADQGVRGNSIALKDIVESDNNTTKGWNLPSKGTIIYTFYDKAEAEEVMENYIPEGTLSDNKVIVDFSDQSLGDSSFLDSTALLVSGSSSSSGGAAAPTVPTAEFSVDLDYSTSGDITEGDARRVDVKYVLKDATGVELDSTYSLMEDVLVDVSITHIDTDSTDFQSLLYNDVLIPAGVFTSNNSDGMFQAMIGIETIQEGSTEGAESFTLDISNIRLGAGDAGYTATTSSTNNTFTIAANTEGASTSTYGYLVENNICDSTMPEWNPGTSSCACASNGMDDTGGTYNIAANATCSIQASGTFTSGTINIGTQTAFATEGGTGQQIYIQLQADSGTTYPLTGDMIVHFSLTSSSSFSNSMNGLDVAGFNSPEYYSITLPGGDLDTLMTPYVLNVINDSTAEPREYADIVIDRIELDPADSSVMLTGVATGMDTQPVTVELSDGYVPVVSKALEFSGNSFFVAEGKTNLNPADTMSAPLYKFSFNDDGEYFPDDITITYQYQGTGTDPITSGDLAENLNTNYSVVIPAGQTSVYIQDLTFVADTVNEGDEQFQVVIQNIDYGSGNNGSSASWDSMDSSYIITIPANSL